MPPRKLPAFGVTKLDPGQDRIGGRVQMQVQRNIRFIETQGNRLAWSRASDCPCSSVNDQTQQADPTCPICHGTNLIYFGPENYIVPPTVGDLDPVQQKLVLGGLTANGKTAPSSAVIRGLMQRIATDQTSVNRVGPWMFGVAHVTVRPENIIGFMDRLVQLDALVNFSESVEFVHDGNDSIPQVLPLRYYAVGVNAVHAVNPANPSQVIRYEEQQDFEIGGANCVIRSNESETGAVVWYPGKAPVSGTKLSIHYSMHPTWVVMEHPHNTRIVTTFLREPNPTTPFGSPALNPIQAMLKLEYLPWPGTSPADPLPEM
jgi:hypothetical protein